MILTWHLPAPFFLVSYPCYFQHFSSVGIRPMQPYLMSLPSEGIFPCLGTFMETNPSLLFSFPSWGIERALIPHFLLIFAFFLHLACGLILRLSTAGLWSQEPGCRPCSSAPKLGDHGLGLLICQRGLMRRVRGSSLVSHVACSQSLSSSWLQKLGVE